MVLHTDIFEFMIDIRVYGTVLSYDMTKVHVGLPVLETVHTWKVYNKLFSQELCDLALAVDTFVTSPDYSETNCGLA